MMKVAAIQMVSTENLNENLDAAARLIAQASEQDAKLVLLPENFAMMSGNEEKKLSVKEQPGKGPIQTFLSEQAKQHQLYLIGGTMPLASPDPNKAYAASLAFDAQGKQIARYNKIHLFDVKIDEQESHMESNTVCVGEDIQTATTPFAKIGLSVCYDLRFPELYRNMLLQGATIMVVPAAFTYKTGLAHWEFLLRARAVENLSFVIAADQGGTHAGGRETYGHSMIIDPWGKVLDSCEFGEHVVMAELDFDYQQQLRANFPVQDHHRLL